jgi:hypothetical protein
MEALIFAGLVYFLLLLSALARRLRRRLASWERTR